MVAISANLGGYKTVSGQTIKYNKLLRTGNLADLSSSGLRFIAKTRRKI